MYSSYALKTKEEKKVEKKLARIKSATLEIKERGILSFWIFVDYEDGGSQGIGGIALDDYCEDAGDRIGTAYGCEMIRQVLICLNVDDFSQMKGKDIWVLGHGKGFCFKPCGIASLKADGGKEFIFEDVLNRMTGKKK